MDQYFVIGPDGAEYGPTDLPGLTQWVREGRVLANTMIRKGGAAPAAAGSLPELAALFATPPPAVAPQIPPMATTVTLPAEFRAWDLIGQAWNLVKPHWLPLGAMFVIVWLISSVPLLGFVIAGAIHVGVSRSLLAMLGGKRPDIGDMFNGFDRFVPALLANLIFAIGVGFGMMLCIVPGIILAIMWMFWSFILAETQLDFWPALQASVALTDGYRWNLFCLMLANIVVIILGVLACCVGVFIAQAVMFTSLALAYRFIQAHPIAKPATA